MFGEWVIHNWQKDDGLPDETVTAIAQGGEGELWLATLKGIATFGGFDFDVHPAPRITGMDLDVSVNAFVARDGRVWSSTPRGLVCWKDDEWLGFPRTNLLESFQVRSFAESRVGLIAIGGLEGEVALLRSNRVERLKSPDVISPHGVFCEFDAEDTLWIFNRRFIGFRRGDQWVPVPTPSPLAEPLMVGPAAGNERVVLHGDQVWLWNGKSLSSERTLDGSITNARAVLRDSRSNIWVASISAGLHCFTPAGRHLRFDQGAGLFHRTARCLFEDREGDIWLGTSSGGLYRIRPRVFHTVGVVDGMPGPVVRAIVEAAPGRLLVGTHGEGLASLEFRDPVWQASKDGRATAPYVWSLLIPTTGEPLLGTYRDGLKRIAGREELPIPLPGESKDAIYSMVEESPGRIWLGTDDGLVRLEGGVPSLFPLPPGVYLKGIRCFAWDSASKILWGGTYEQGGLFRIDSTGFKSFTMEDGLGSDRISSLLAEADGTVWIGTRDGGLSRFKGGRIRTVGMIHGLPSGTVASILDDGLGCLWIGTSKGIVRATKSALHAAMDSGSRIAGAVLFGRQDGLANIACVDGYQNTALKDSAGRLWFATGRGLAWTDPAKLETDAIPPRVAVDSIGYRKASSDTLLGAEFSLRRNRRLENEPIVIPAGSRQFSVRYSAIALRAMGQVRFRTRLSGANGPGQWMDMEGRREAEFFELAPGSYRFEVVAENQFGAFDPAGARVDFRVLPHLWERGWFWVVVGVLLVGGAAGVTGSIQRQRLRTTAERLRQQQAVAEARARFEAMVNSTSDLVAFASADGRLFSLNRSGRSMLGLPLEKEPGTMTLASLHSPQGWSTTGGQGLADAMNDGVWSGESTLIRADGVSVVVSEVLVVSRSGGNSGLVDFIALVARDLSDRIAAETARADLEGKLRQSQKMEALGTMAGGIAHDFNNILAAIIPAAELAKADAGNNEELVENLDHILTASERAAALVRQILTFSRKRSSTLEPVDIVAVVDEVTRLLRASVPGMVEVVVEEADGLPQVLGDATQLHQVLMNLCTNSVHAMRGRSGQLIVRLEPFVVDPEMAAVLDPVKPGLCVRVSVTDTGHGMDEATLRRIFDPFFTTKGPGEGTGLGLSVVHGIVRDHGGAIRVYSRPGQGTTFNVYLPAVVGDPSSNSPDQPITAPGGSGQQIVLVDDEKMLCTVLSQTLRRQGFRVTAFSDPLEALEWIQANAREIDLVISDLTMPHLTGIELGSKIHAIRPEVPVLIVSGFAGRVSAEELAKAGVAEVLQKPVSAERLTRAVLAALRRA